MARQTSLRPEASVAWHGVTHARNLIARGGRISAVEREETEQSEEQTEQSPPPQYPLEQERAQHDDTQPLEEIMGAKGTSALPEATLALSRVTLSALGDGGHTSILPTSEAATRRRHFAETCSDSSDRSFTSSTRSSSAWPSFTSWRCNGSRAASSRVEISLGPLTDDKSSAPRPPPPPLCCLPPDTLLPPPHPPPPLYPAPPPSPPQQPWNEEGSSRKAWAPAGKQWSPEGGRVPTASAALLTVRLAPTQVHILPDPDREASRLGLRLCKGVGQLVVLPLHSIASPLVPCWRSPSLLVTVECDRLPLGVDAGALQAAAAHGPASVLPRGCVWPLVFAWAFNLLVLLGAVAFLVYVTLTTGPGLPAQPTAALGNAGGDAAGEVGNEGGSFGSVVARGFALSLCLSFLVKDPAVAALIALMPTRSSRSRRVWKSLITLLNALLAL